MYRLELAVDWGNAGCLYNRFIGLLNSPNNRVAMTNWYGVIKRTLIILTVDERRSCSTQKTIEDYLSALRNSRTHR